MVNQAGLSTNQPEQTSANPSTASMKEVTCGNSAPKPPPAAQARFHYKQTPSLSLGLEKQGRVLKQAADGKADNRPISEKQNSSFLAQEAPVRDERGTGWSATGSHSDAAFQLSRLSHPGRKVEPVKPFSVSVLSAGDAEEFGHLHPDFSDMTVYNEITQKTPHEQVVSCPKPTPGSRAERQQELCPRPLFSELRQHHQDSGFGSPFYLQK